MLERILDDYYTNKLKIRIEDTLLDYILDYKFVKIGDRINLFVKRTKYNDKEYELIISFDKARALEYLIDYKEMGNLIIKRINHYLEWNKK